MSEPAAENEIDHSHIDRGELENTITEARETWQYAVKHSGSSPQMYLVVSEAAKRLVNDFKQVQQLAHQFYGMSVPDLEGSYS
jgi:hypothetical protein